MKLIKNMFVICVTALSLAGCKVSLNSSSGSTADDAPKVIEGLAALEENQKQYALNTIRAFYAKGFDGIKKDIHPDVAKEFDGIKAAALEKLRTNSADLDKAQYFGHGFGKDRGFDYTIVQFKLPTNNGYDMAKVVLIDDGDCCQIVGFHLHKKFEKSFQIGGKDK